MRQPDSPVPGRPGLTPIRTKIVQVIDDSVRRNGYPPSIREIADAVGLASTSSVHHHLSVLEAQGLVSRAPRCPRTAQVRPIDGGAGHEGSFECAEPMVHVPLEGRIAAGLPRTAARLPGDVIPLPRMLTGEGNLIMLTVSGDSMTGAAIADGDLVVVRCQPDAENGEIVAAHFASDTEGGWEATVKTLSKRDGHVWLLPQNPAYPPILGDQATIIGKVVTVLRRV